MFSPKQTYKFDYFICYYLESGWHMTRPNQGLSLGRGKSLGTRLPLLNQLCFSQRGRGTRVDPGGVWNR